MHWGRIVAPLAAALLLTQAAWAAAPATIRARSVALPPAPMSRRRKARVRSWAYTTDPESNVANYFADFHKLFPKIAPNFIRLQAGALYAKTLAERQAHANLVDVLAITDMSFVLDFQKRGGYAPYVSPEMAAYKPEYKSQPEGLWTWGALIVAGIAYNPTLVPADQAPKTWKDLLDPKWKDAINVKVSNSGLQHETWYLIRQIYGEDYWKQLGELNPRAPSILMCSNSTAR